jgi:putative transposase
MPRSARLDAPGVLHHVMGRGIERQPIFLSDEDRNDFLSRLGLLAQEGCLRVYAWVLLPNHFHLLCKTEKVPLARSMRRLLTGYGVKFNRRHNRNGHLFQNRYKSIVCQEDSYLMELVRYIHLNLMRAGRVKGMGELNRCPWSGHSALMGYQSREWQDTEYVLSYFGKGVGKRRKYLRFVKEGVSLGRRPELVGGGLIRSMGGWSGVLALRKRGEKAASDERILGDGEFVERVLEEWDEIGRANLRLGGVRKTLLWLAQQVCENWGVTMEELKSGSRRQVVLKAREEFSQVAVKGLGYSGAEVARYLGVTGSCVTRIVADGQLTEDVRLKYLNLKARPARTSP